MKLSTKVAVFKRVSLSIVGAKHVDWGRQAPPAPFGAGPAGVIENSIKKPVSAICSDSGQHETKQIEATFLSLAVAN